MPKKNAKKSRRDAPMRRSRRFKRKVLWVLLGLPVAGMVMVGLAFWWLSHDLPSFRTITDYKPPLVTTVLAREGRVLGYFYKE
ncbi:MAG: hypothetical protein C0405_12425, partial [Desulfovibrio sp.]|nr:hypothetical protein [Desulfovibrio sp.]